MSPTKGQSLLAGMPPRSTWLILPSHWRLVPRMQGLWSGSGTLSLVDSGTQDSYQATLTTVEVGSRGFIHLPSFSLMYTIVNAIQAMEGSFCIWCKWSWREDNWLTWHPACPILPYVYTCYEPPWICVQLKVNCFSPFVSRPSFICACSSPHPCCSLEWQYLAVSSFHMCGRWQSWYLCRSGRLFAVEHSR